MKIFTNEQFDFQILNSTSQNVNDLKTEIEHFSRLKEEARNLNQLYNAEKNKIYDSVEKFWLSFEKLEEEKTENLYISDGSLNRWKITKEDLLLTIPWGIYYKLKDNVPDKIRKEYFEKRIDFILEYLKNKQIEIIWGKELEKYHINKQNSFSNINHFQEQLLKQDYFRTKKGPLSEFILYQILKKHQFNTNNFEIEKTDIITDIKDHFDFKVKINNENYFVDTTITEYQKRLKSKRERLDHMQAIDPLNNYILHINNHLTHPHSILSGIQNLKLINNNPINSLNFDLKEKIVDDFITSITTYGL